MRNVSMDGASLSTARLARMLRLAVSALAIGAALGIPRARALDLDSADGLNTETIASRDRLRVWDNIKKFGVETDETNPTTWLLKAQKSNE